MSTTDIASKIREFEDRVSRAETEHAKAQGRVEEITKRLQDEHDCNSPEDAAVLLETLREDIQELDAQLQKGVETLEAKYAKTEDT